jgi:rod shape-determining protein MreD
VTGDFDHNARRDAFGSKINRDHMPVLVHGLPVLTIMLASLTPILPFITAAPVVPPMGLIMLLAWRAIRPGLLPLWIGLPLGAFDDLFSGQPFGSAIMLWSLAMLTFELVEARVPWRSFWLDWLIAADVIVAAIALAALFSGAGFDLERLLLIGPQLLVSILLFPLVARAAAIFDRLRLMRIRRLN